MQPRVESQIQPVAFDVNTSIVGLSSSSAGGRRKKGGRRGEAKPPLPPQPPSQLRNDKTLGKKETKPDARTAGERKGRPVAEAASQGSLRQEGERRKKPRRQQQQEEKPKRVVRWKCAAGCGACCKLDKGPRLPHSRGDLRRAPRGPQAVQEYGRHRWMVHQLRRVHTHLQHLRRAAYLLQGGTKGFRGVLWRAKQTQHVRQGSLQCLCGYHQDGVW